MIPVEVENRIARYFFHNYLPEEVMMLVEDKLLTQCISYEEEDLDFDELVLLAIDIIIHELDDKQLK